MLATIVGMFIANFLTFSDERLLLQQANKQLASASRHVYRKLSVYQRDLLAAAFAHRQKEFPLVIVTSVSSVEAERYAYDFAMFFQNQNFSVLALPNEIPLSNSDTGLMIGVKSPRSLPQIDKDFLAAIGAAQIPIRVVRFNSPWAGSPDFDLFVGPVIPQE